MAGEAAVAERLRAWVFYALYFGRVKPSAHGLVKFHAKFSFSAVCRA